MQPHSASAVTEAVARNVRAEAGARRVSQGTVGAHLSLSQTNISRRFVGVTPFTVAELVELARIWDIPLSQLLPETLVSRSSQAPEEGDRS